MDGILNLNKPPGITSFRAVSRVRQLAGRVKTGHGGTLDPFATGVLPIMLGQATRVSEYLLRYPKTYRAVVLLGKQTDTLDITGNVTATCGFDHITQQQLTSALGQFRGLIEQVPPVYSAIKHSGRRLYDMARQGLNPEPESRTVQIFSIDLVNFQPPSITLAITCGKGTYIRSLARDLGLALGSCGCLAELQRTGYGPFRVDDGLTLEEAETASREGTLRNRLQPLDTVLTGFPRVELEESIENLVMHGHSTHILDVEKPEPLYRAYNRKGNLVALLAAGDEPYCFRPVKVFVQALQSLTTGT